MDKTPGAKETAFTWAMGRLILARIGEGETIRQITADPAMPAYATVYRWMQVVPEFRHWVKQQHAARSLQALAARDVRRRATRRRRKDGQPWRSGQRPRIPAEALDAVLRQVRAGASLTDALRAPGAPSVKAFYTRVRGCPGFREAYRDAVDWRDFLLETEAFGGIPSSVYGNLAAAYVQMRVMTARRGRLQPKMYRIRPPRLWET